MNGNEKMNCVILATIAALILGIATIIACHDYAIERVRRENGYDDVFAPSDMMRVWQKPIRRDSEGQ